MDRSEGHTNPKVVGPRKGMAVFSVVALVVICIVFVMAFSQHYLSGVVSQRESIYVGRRALYLAESAINEALLDFVKGMNDPSGSVAGWYGLLRSSFSPGAHFSYSFFPGYAQEHCTGSDNEAVVQDVRVDVWALQPINDLDYERCGLLTITAVVAIPRRSRSFLNSYIYRNVQRSYELKQVQVTAPEPFGDFALFLLKWEYLRKAYGDYLRDQDPFDRRRQEAVDNIKKLLDEIGVFLDAKILIAQEGLDKLREAQDRIPDFGPFPCPICMIGVPPVPALHCPKDHGWSRSEIEAAVESVLNEQGLTIDDLQDIADTDTSVLVPPEPAEMNWPPFRSNMSLNNPVVVRGSVSSGDYRMNFPPWPALPPFPPVDPDWCHNWSFPDLSNFTDMVEQWKNQYDSQVVSRHQANWQSELRRHEGIFELLAAVPPSFGKLVPSYQYRRASWRFHSSDEMNGFIGRNGGRLAGGYWISGDCSIGSYAGFGTVACSGNATVSGGAASGGLMTVYAGGDISAGGGTRAALFTPNGTVTGGPVEGLVVENFLSTALSVTNDPAYQSSGPAPDRMVVTISPYPVATNFLRKRY